MSSVSQWWESIGRELLDSSDHKYLTDIDTPYNTSHDCMWKMLRKWLREYTITTWRHIIDALRSTGEHQLADKLKAKNIPGELTTITSSQYSLESQHGENGMM